MGKTQQGDKARVRASNLQRQRVTGRPERAKGSGTPKRNGSGLDEADADSEGSDSTVHPDFYKHCEHCGIR